MKIAIIEWIKEIISAIWVGIVSGSIGGWLMNLYNFTKTGIFKFSVFSISIWIWGFVGYLTSEFTSSGALSWIAGAISMKIFDIVNENWNELIRKILEEKYWVNLKKNEKNK